MLAAFKSLWRLVQWILAVLLIPIIISLAFAVYLFYMGVPKYSIETFQTIVLLVSAFMGYLFMTRKD